MPEIIIIHDLIDPNDPQGRSYKDVNLTKNHNIPVGSLVELDTGARLFVVYHSRDCDGTPLYNLCLDKENVEYDGSGFFNRKWHNGYSEDSLKIVQYIKESVENPTTNQGVSFENQNDSH